jgi:hypothetical protein
MNTHYMSFIRKYRVGGKIYLAEVESRRVKRKVVQRFIRKNVYLFPWHRPVEGRVRGAGARVGARLGGQPSRTVFFWTPKNI